MNDALAQPFVHTSLPGRVVFGAGRRLELADEVARLSIEDDRARLGTRIFLIADAAAAATGDEATALLDGRVVEQWDDVLQHVPVELAERARTAARSSGANMVVSIGGGSATGLAKAIALTERLPIIAIPTTYAGSEQTTIYGLTGVRHKQTGRDLVVLPKTVIYDPELTLGLPPGVTGPSSFNALAHAVEAMWVPERNPVTTALALEGVRAIVRSLPTVMGAPDDLVGRSGLLYGAYLAGVALAATSTGMHHKLAHVIGGTFGLVHADTHSVILPHVVAFNGAVLPDEMGRLGTALGGEDSAAALWDLADASGVPTSLASIGLTADDLPEVADRALAEITTNPRPVSRGDLVELLGRALAGDRPHLRDWSVNDVAEATDAAAVGQ